MSNPLLAATSTWLGNTSNLWNTAGNWSGSAVPTAGSTLFFGTPGSSGVALSDDVTGLSVGGSGVDGIVFGSSASSYTISKPLSQTITLNSSGTGLAITDLSYFLQTISVPLVYGSNQTIQVGAATGPALSSLTLSGAQSGGFRLIKTGNGLLTLSAANSLGGLTINAGTVSVATDGSLGTAPVSATPASIILNGGALRTQVNTAFAINANRGIALGDATVGSGGTINVYSTGGSGTALTYNGILANNGGTNSLTKTGVLGLILGGANTYTGATKINQGQLMLDFTAASAPTSNIINSASNLVMGDVPTSFGISTVGNPVLLLQGSNTGTTSQTFNGVTLNPGNSNIVARGGNSTFHTTLALGALSHSAGGTVGFSLLTGGSTGQGIITTTTANTNGILGGWATTAAVQSGTAAVPQTDWATVSSGSIVAYTGYTDFVTAATVTSSTASNFRINSTSTGNATLSAGTTDLNTIQVTDTTSRTIAVGAGNTLRLGQYGGVWKTSGTSNTLTIGATVATGGSLTAGGAPNTAGEIVFNANGAATTNSTIQVNSAIVDSGTGAVTVVKTGLAILTLSGTNTYSGGTFINQGQINANTATAFGTKDVNVVPGGVAWLGGTNLTYANNFNIAGTSVLILNGNTASGKITLLGDTVIGGANTSNGGAISGQITGDYNLSIMGNVTTLSNTSNNYSGNLGINGTGGPLGSATVTVKLGDNEVLSNGVGKGNVYISGGATGPAILDLNGKSETVNGLVSSGTFFANTRVTNTAATAASLTLGDNDQTATYAGIIVDGTSGGVVSITKIGSGVQTFSGSNTYTGTTTVSAGTLLLSSTTANSTIAGSVTIDVQANAKLDVTNISTAGGFQVGSGQTLKGNGLVVGGVTINSGGFLSPGASPGNLTVTNGLTVAGTYNWELGALSTSNPGTDYDVVTITAGNVTLTGGAIALTLGAFAPSNVAFWQTNETWAGILNNTGAGTLTGNFGAIDNSAWSSLGTFSTVASGNDINLVWTAVPEPSTWVLLAGAGLFFVIARRRRLA